MYLYLNQKSLKNMHGRKIDEVWKAYSIYD
jgi:hypothetical protein